jgi:hypothetical protein
VGRPGGGLFLQNGAPDRLAGVPACP